MPTATAADVITCPSCATRNRVPRAHGGSPQCGRCHAPLPWLVEAGDADFDGVTTTSSLPVFVDMWAPWCGPCKVMEPSVQQLSRDMAGRLKVVKVDADRAPALSARFGIRGVPTLLLLDRGRVVDRRSGALMGGALRRWVEETLSRQTASR
ncbi:MAG TPA: thioredoxin domain-containing protein [Candidatus Dormibacteraeota bacterium]|jgi:thioredoxin 2|nr:thioredoxin domain-containing protein [Candidatus Dormibacteraeota bacterium]